MYASLTETLERRKFLLRELDHRCKNTLAAVQSIADQTLRRSDSPAHFVEAFTGRLGALSQAHELLTREAWGRARLLNVLEEALAPFGGIDGRRIRVSGPEITLTPETAVAMHMTFHELAVNAAKYGALATPAGRLEVTWNVDMTAEPRGMDLTWRETGGPLVPETPARGFGSRLIETGVARALGGEGRLAFDRKGVSFHLKAPVSGRLSLG
jgi:two-component sensor histidine kinase